MFRQAASTIATFILAAITLAVLLANRAQVKASLKQADAAEDQVGVMRDQVEVSRKDLNVSREQFRQNQEQVQEALEVSQRPFVFPLESLELADSGRGLTFNFDELNDHGKTQQVALKNGGAGIAFNMWGALLEPPPTHDSGVKQLPRMRSVVPDTPIAVGGEALIDSRAGPFAFSWDTYVGDDRRNTLCPSKNSTTKPALGELPVVEQAYSVLARLTITYTDIFGKSHASQFDYTDLRRWVFVRFVPKIPYGLEELGSRSDFSRIANQVSFQNSYRAAQDRQ